MSKLLTIHERNVKYGMAGSLFYNKENDLYFVVSNIKDDKTDYYRESPYVKGDEEDAIRSRCAYFGKPEEDWKMLDKTFTYIRAIPHTFERFKEGDLVDVLDIAREEPRFGEWCEEKKEMIGKKGLEIKEVLGGGGGYRIFTKDRTNWFYFSYYLLAPHHPELDETVEKMEKYGGSFVRTLAELARHADTQNLRKIKETWADYWKQYEEM